MGMPVVFASSAQAIIDAIGNPVLKDTVFILLRCLCRESVGGVIIRNHNNYNVVFDQDWQITPGEVFPLRSLLTSSPM